METILVIDDDNAIRRTLELHLMDRGFRVFTGEDIATGRQLWQSQEPDIVILDLKLPDGEGTALLEEQMRAGFEAVVVMITGYHDMEYAIRAMKSGAFNYVHKPLNVDELDIVVSKAADQIRARKRARTVDIDWSSRFKPDRIAGQSPAILEIHKQIGLASKSQVNVLIIGESGTGKELVARAIHQNSSPDQPFVAVNCSAIVPTLMESELFGHERGAFTGAHQRKIGKLELAALGTLFLDEIGDLSQELQAKLLRVLQEKTFERVGGTTPITFGGRVVAATHRDLEDMIKAQRFREDLYFRLKVVVIGIPPLRERREDLPILTTHLLEKINRELHRKVTRVPDEVLKRLMQYGWPGNVRELENVLTQAVVRSTGDTLTSDLLGEPTVSSSEKRELKSLADVEKEHIGWVLIEVDGNLGKACKILGITRPTLRKKMEDYGIKIPLH
jgi:two-component system response regulator AtoC